MKVTNSSTSRVLNESSNTFLDEEIYNLTEELHQIKRSLKDFSFFSTLKSIGLTEENVTIQAIADRLPSNSIFLYHKYGENNPIYPQRTGMLIAIKALDNSRVKFTYSNFDNTWIGFYDELRGSGLDKWSGWKTTGGASSGNTSGETITATTVMTTNLIGNSKSPINLQCSLLPSNTDTYNLGWSESRYLQVCAQKGYFDTIEVKNPVIVTGTMRSFKSANLEVGQTYFDTDLNKPLWYNGTKWVDAMGNEVK